MSGGAIVVLSGGQDSTTSLFIAQTKHKIIDCVTFKYGQRHSREIEEATTVALLADVNSHEIVDLGPILYGTSPLTNDAEALEEYQSFDEMNKIIGDRVELTFVPMRNALFLTLACAKAAAHLPSPI